MNTKTFNKLLDELDGNSLETLKQKNAKQRADYRQQIVTENEQQNRDRNEQIHDGKLRFRHKRKQR